MTRAEAGDWSQRANCALVHGLPFFRTYKEPQSKRSPRTQSIDEEDQGVRRAASLGRSLSAVAPAIPSPSESGVHADLLLLSNIVGS